ncbi:hypothetical protein L917_21176 [Phytophthora nicotianae]|uniref:Uncharacterized protein n=1 Tax=Phytophthora nicotianae TaxID=4792 RepID=W2JYE3_PHYNI|nr:hypothetical protein L917_21176 [Phytophthora nicotianae]
MSGNETSLNEDLQRCRRLVAAMRGQVLAPSLKQEALKQLVRVVSEQQERQQLRGWTESSLPSPRKQYLREIQVARIKTIQRRWRRHLLQKRILAKVRMIQKWKNRQGVSRFRKSAVIIQKTFRGHFVRKHKIDLALYIAGLLSKAERLRSDREAFHLKCDDIQQELQQVRLDMEIIRDKISEKEKEIANLTSKGRTARDSSALLKDAIKYVKNYQNEVVELEELARDLEKELQEIREKEPVVHVAARVIQALFRGVHCRMEQIREQQRQRQTYTRMLQSKEFCYDRMHAAWLTRSQKMWDASARTIAGLYHIQQAKFQLYLLRRRRAGRRISRLYLDVKARTSCTAKQDLLWMKVKRQAKEIAARKLQTLLQLTWFSWLRYVQNEDQTRKLIAEREAAGLNQWRSAKAKWFLSAHRSRIVKRESLECEIMPRLNCRVLHHIRNAIQTEEGEESSTKSSQDISSAFLLFIRNDIWTWRVPNKQLYTLAKRYNLPLSLLNLEQINQWLAEEAPDFVDLYAPLPTQTLLRFSEYMKSTKLT